MSQVNTTQNPKAATKSLWIANTNWSTFPTIDREILVDVAVIGGGITGLTTALMLKRAGKRVALIDRSYIAHGESGRTTAHLTEVVDTRYFELISRFGLEGARLVAESSRAAIEKIHTLAEELGIACDFERLPGYLYAEDSNGLAELKRELSAISQLGLSAALTQEVPLPFRVRGAIRFERQAQFHPLKYLQALADAIPGEGSHVFEQTRVEEIEPGNPHRIHTLYGSVRAHAIAICTNSPISNAIGAYTKIAAYRSYALALQPDVPTRLPGLFWDTASPYHYLRSAGDYMIIGGEDHKTGHKTRNHQDAGQSFVELERYTRSHFGPGTVRFRWSGQILNSADGLPYIGKASPRLYVATGYGGNGMTFGTVAGILLSDLILKKRNPWASLYQASRIPILGSFKRYLAENLDYPLHMIQRWITAADTTAIDEIELGQGKLIEIQNRKVAVYKDDEGLVYGLSPSCQHLGCLVQWNNAETSWDCPCHGSRYDIRGKVLSGPATRDLEIVLIHKKAQWKPSEKIA